MCFMLVLNNTPQPAQLFFLSYVEIQNKDRTSNFDEISQKNHQWTLILVEAAVH